MGDLTEMVPFDGLDGTKRMMRWDFYATRLAEGILRDEGRPPEERNLLLGLSLDTMDTTALSAMVWAMLASADLAMKVKGGVPRLSYDEVSQRMNQHNVQACVDMVATCRALNQPDAAEDGKKKATPKKRRARGK